MVRLWTIDCPRCIQVERRLILNNIQFEKKTDKKQMEEKGILDLPMLEVNGELLKYHQIFKWIENNKGDNNNE